MHLRLILLLLIAANAGIPASGQRRNVLLNGDFEDINTCSEYNSECGVEGWFYLREVKAQMLGNEGTPAMLGKNSYLIYYDWRGDQGFTPIIGSLLPCRLQAGHAYTFRGMINVKLNAQLEFKPGVAISPAYYVPRRKFATGFVPQEIAQPEPMTEKGWFRFEYRYVAKGDEDYLTFGSFVSQDSTAGKRQLTGTQTIAVTLDNFELVPEDPTEGPCEAWEGMRSAIYAYDFRHKEMDYALYATGKLKLLLPADPAKREPRPQPVAVRKNEVSDTLRLGDLSFDFNKANLRDSTRARLASYFKGNDRFADSIIIEGHTDSVGNDAFNLKLSQARCVAVEEWLTANNIIQPGNIRIAAYGRSRPEASNRTTEGRARNRRVELILYWREKP
ncbi:MAG: OmpA family protein [Chitinophagaceae bacterium]|nr:MAG: OmpA family protein [Chitinophagaceae bacterium]